MCKLKRAFHSPAKGFHFSTFTCIIRIHFQITRKQDINFRSNTQQ